MTRLRPPQRTMARQVFSESLESHRQSFLESLRVHNLSAATLAGRGQSLDVFFRYLDRVGIADIREVNRDTVKDYQAWLMEPGRYAVGTVAAHLAALRQFFAFLEASGAVLINPCLRLVIPKQPRRLPRAVLTRAQARQILHLPDRNEPKGIRDRALLELFYSSGLRLGEMARLSIHDADLRNGFLRVTRGKGNRDRVVPIGKKACEALGSWLEIRSMWIESSRNGVLQDALWLAPVTPHQPLKKEAIAAIVRRHGRVSPHRWRHTFATHLVSSGANIAHVQRLLGHRSIKTTEIYTRVSIPEIKKTFRRAHPRARVRRSTFKVRR